jgi:hypothetical protein
MKKITAAASLISLATASFGLSMFALASEAQASQANLSPATATKTYYVIDEQPKASENFIDNVIDSLNKINPGITVSTYTNGATKCPAQTDNCVYASSVSNTHGVAYYGSVSPKVTEDQGLITVTGERVYVAVSEDYSSTSNGYAMTTVLQRVNGTTVFLGTRY